MGLESIRTEVYASNVVLSAAAIIRGEKRKVLVILEGDTPYNGMWVIPMGYVHTDEKVIDAVSREVKEETGVDVELEGLVGVYDDFITIDNKHVHHVIVCYGTKALNYPPTVTREAKEYAWTGIEQFKQLNAPTVVKDMLSDYFAKRRIFGRQ